MKKSLIAVLMVVGALLPASGGARTADFNCTGFATGGTFANVVVPAGQSCTLDHVRVTGNVTVKTAASLSVTTSSGDSTIAGKITGNACDSIDLESTGLSFRIVVGGDLNITNCTGSSFSGGRGSSGPGTPPQSLLIGGNTKCAGNQDECVFDYAIIAGNLDCSGKLRLHAAVGRDREQRDREQQHGCRGDDREQRDRRQSRLQRERAGCDQFRQPEHGVGNQVRTVFGAVLGC